MPNPDVALPRVTHGYKSRGTGSYMQPPVTLRTMSLKELAAANRAVDEALHAAYAERARLIAKARDEKYSWAEIAEVLEMTVHGAIKASRMG